MERREVWLVESRERGPYLEQELDWPGIRLYGNLDAITVLPHASEPALRHEVARQLALGRANGGRFAMSTGSPITPGTSVERVRRYTDLVRELG